MMTRADMIKRTMLLDAIGRVAKAEADGLRYQLQEQARQELTETGAAPTWRLPDIASVTLPVSRERVVVRDERAVTDWCSRNRPGAVDLVYQIRAGELEILLKEVADNITAGGEIDGKPVVCTGDGDVVPGLALIPGGTPGAISIRPSKEARRVLDDTADGMLRALLDPPTPPEPGPDSPPDRCVMCGTFEASDSAGRCSMCSDATHL